MRTAEAVMRHTLTVPASAAGERLDRWLTGRLNYSRATIQKCCRDGAVTLDGRAAKAAEKVTAGATVTLTYEEEHIVLKPEPVPLSICYEDDDFLIVNKPRGMVVHPSYGHRGGTLVQALLAHTGGRLADTGDPIRPGIVHRLDRDTSGLMLAAKSKLGYETLAAQIRAHTAERIYLALVHGVPSAKRGVIRLPLGRDPKNRMKWAVVSKDGREAVTHFTVLDTGAKYSLLRLRLETGRTHQIRVHLAHIGCPVVGDPVYGRRRDHFPIAGQALHAAELAVERPRDGERVHCVAPLPEDMEQCLIKAREENGHVEK